MGTNRLSLLLDDIDTVILFLLIIFPIQNQIFSMLKGDYVEQLIAAIYTIYLVFVLYTQF